MKPEITVSTSDLERLEGLLSKPPTRNRSDLDGLRAELDRANILDTDGMPADVIMMNSRARFREETSGREYELTLAWPHEANAADGKVSIFLAGGQRPARPVGRPAHRLADPRRPRDPAAGAGREPRGLTPRGPPRRRCDPSAAG